MGSWVPADDPSHHRQHLRGSDGVALPVGDPLHTRSPLLWPGIDQKANSSTAGLTSLYFVTPLLCEEGGSWSSSQ